MFENGIVFIGILQEDIVLYYDWPVIHSLEVCTHHYCMLSKTMILTVKLSFGLCQTARNMSAIAMPEELTNNCIWIPMQSKVELSIQLLIFNVLICSWMRYVSDSYIVHFTSVARFYVLLDSTKVVSFVNASDEELLDEMVSEYFGSILNESGFLHQQCFSDTDTKQLADTSNKMVW